MYVTKLVVTSQQPHLLGGLDFIAEQICDDFHSVGTPVHVVTEEEQIAWAQARTQVPEHLLEVYQVKDVTVKIT